LCGERRLRVAESKEQGETGELHQPGI